MRHREYRPTTEQYARTIEQLQSTTDSLTSIGKNIDLAYYVVSYIQADGIENGILDPKYQRLHNGLIQWQYDKAVELLKTTDLDLKGIGIQVGISRHTVRNVQNKAIKNGELDPKYSRLYNHIIQWQEDRIIELLGTTTYTLLQIGQEVGLSRNLITRIQNKAIEKGNLEIDRQRLERGFTRWQYERAVELLKTTDWNLKRIGKEVGLGGTKVGKIQKQAIEESCLEPKYRRLKGEVIQFQHDRSLELLNTTDYSLAAIGKEVGISGNSVGQIQLRAISEGKLDPLRKRPFKSQDNILEFREFLETHEESQQVREILAAHEELTHYLSPEQQEAALHATAQRVYENLNGQKAQFPPEKLVYVIRNLNVGVVQKPNSNDSTPPLPEVLGRAYRAQIIGEEATEEILGRWLSENLNLDRLQTLSKAQRVVELQKELVGVEYAN